MAFTQGASLNQIYLVQKLTYIHRQLNNILSELDTISDKKAKTRRKTVPSLRRVNLGRVHKNAPELPVYPFMLSGKWMADNPESARVRSKDPAGIEQDYESADYSTEDNNNNHNSPAAQEDIQSTVENIPSSPAREALQVK